MLFERLMGWWRVAGPKGAFAAEPVLLLALVSLGLMLFGPPGAVFLEPPVVQFTEIDNPAFAARDVDADAWRQLPVTDIEPPEGAAWVRWEDPPLPENLDAPLALHTTGPFSATFYWNGTLIGQKGVPGESREAEQAGPIDAASSIPSDLIQPSGNVVAIRLSSHLAGYDPPVILHSLYVGPYVSDARRSLRYYAPTILLAGALAALAIAIFLMARAKGDLRAIWLVVGIGGLLIAMSAEVSRSLVNYTYDWHQPRQAVVMMGIVLLGASLVRFVVVRWPLSGFTARAGLWYIAGAVVLALVIASMGHGYDYRSTVSLSIIMTAAAFWLARAAFAGERGAGGLALAVLVFPIFAVLFPGDFLDRAVYAFSVALFGYLLLRRRELIWPPAPAARVRLQVSGEVQYLAPQDIRYLKAAGNYTEVHRADGTWVLDTRGFARVLAEMQGLCTRIHRSYAVNLQSATSIRTAEGSRYTLVLEGGAELPIGRSRIGEVRAFLEGHH